MSKGNVFCLTQKDIEEYRNSIHEGDRINTLVKYFTPKSINPDFKEEEEIVVKVRKNLIETRRITPEDEQDFDKEDNLFAPDCEVEDYVAAHTIRIIDSYILNKCNRIA